MAAKAINSWKEAWESAKEESANVRCRFHDMRHMAVTRMLENGVALTVAAPILGWSPATTVRMAKKYGHIGQVAQRQAVAWLEHHPTPTSETDDHPEATTTPMSPAVPLESGSRTVN